MTGPGDEKAAAAGHGRRRASCADRDQAVHVLKAAFVQGRLTKDEFDARIGLTFSLVPGVFRDSSYLTTHASVVASPATMSVQHTG